VICRFFPLVDLKATGVKEEKKLAGDVPTLPLMQTTPSLKKFGQLAKEILPANHPE